jgi:hypothetical protein
MNTWYKSPEVGARREEQCNQAGKVGEMVGDEF